MSVQQICFENDHSDTLAPFMKLRTAGASPYYEFTPKRPYTNIAVTSRHFKGNRLFSLHRR
jgi:hypothetical protein